MPPPCASASALASGRKSPAGGGCGGGGGADGGDGGGSAGGAAEAAAPRSGAAEEGHVAELGDVVAEVSERNAEARQDSIVPELRGVRPLRALPWAAEISSRGACVRGLSFPLQPR